MTPTTQPVEPSAEAMAAAEAIIKWYAIVHLVPAAHLATLIDSSFAELRKSAATVLKGFDDGVFVRDTSKDHEPGWSVKLLPYIVALGKLKNFTEPTTPGAGRGK